MATLLEKMQAKSSILFKTGHNVTSGSYYPTHTTAAGSATTISKLRLQRPRTQHNNDGAGQREDGAATLVVPSTEATVFDVVNGQIVIDGERYQFAGTLTESPLVRKYRLKRVDHKSVRLVKGKVSSTQKGSAPE